MSEHANCSYSVPFEKDFCQACGREMYIIVNNKATLPIALRSLFRFGVITANDSKACLDCLDKMGIDWKGDSGHD